VIYETFFKLLSGVTNPELVGDKVKWFKNSLQPVAFSVYQQTSSLGAAWSAMASRKLDHDMTGISSTINPTPIQNGTTMFR